MSNQAMAKEARVRPGEVLADKYVVERVLAEGGMGVVVAARHNQLGRRVALKFLLPELCTQKEVVARFLREAQSMTSIQNEHVARVLDVGTTAEGAPYMVMEFLEGEDLGQMLERRGRLGTEEAVEFVLQGMEAVAEAHLHGIVHRDLKPSNLFVTQRPDGSPLVKVLDFGISKVSTEGAAADLTHAQGLLGSPLYMAPEQIRSSRSVDVRADVWALGIILYELMCGHTPFDDAETVQAVLAAIVADDPPSLQSVRPDVPAGLSDIVARCLKRPRDERFATVAELATALHPFATREARLSIERIERVEAHSKRLSSPEIRVATPATPPPSTKTVPVSLPPSPLAATAVASSDEQRDRTPAPSSSLRIARLDVEDEIPARDMNTPGALSRSTADAPSPPRRWALVAGAGMVVAALVVGVVVVRSRANESPTVGVIATAASTTPTLSRPTTSTEGQLIPTAAESVSVAAPTMPTVSSPVAKATTATARTGFPSPRSSSHVAARPPASTSAAPPASTTVPTPVTSASGRKKRELDDSPYEK